MKRTSKPLALACAVGLVLAGAAAAQPDAPTPAQQKELDAARAQLDRATQHYAELSRQYHAPGMAPMVMTYEKQIVRKPVLGVLLAPDPQSGVRIAGVTPDSAAAAAGLKAGDRLVSVDGNAIAGADGEARLASLRAGLDDIDDKTPLRIGYERDGREHAASVTPRLDQRVFVWNENAGQLLKLSGKPNILVDQAGALQELTADAVEIDDLSGDSPVLLRGNVKVLPHGVAPEVHREVRSIAFAPDCKGKAPCAQPMLLEAFRWNGLNLASLDAQLGRYFGTDQGVLVLSPGPRLPELQAGDVIRSIDGKPVATPREAMDALRSRKAGDKASLALLRDHHDTSVQVTVPKAMPLPIPPIPPIAPAPPAPPPVVGMLPAPPAPPAPPEAHEIGVIPSPPAPPAPPPPPPPVD